MTQGHVVDPSDVRRAVRAVVDPCSIATGAPVDLVDMGLIKSITIEGQHVSILLRLTSPVCWQAGNIIAAVEEVVGALDGVQGVRCAADTTPWEWTYDMMAPRAKQRLRALRPHPGQIDARPNRRPRSPGNHS